MIRRRSGPAKVSRGVPLPALPTPPAAASRQRPSRAAAEGGADLLRRAVRLGHDPRRFAIHRSQTVAPPAPAGLRSPAPAVEVLQRKASAQDTDFGRFVADPYQAFPGGVLEEAGAHMVLKFEAGDAVKGRIGLIQTVKRRLWEEGKEKEGTAKTSGLGFGKGSVLEGEHRDWRVDQLTELEVKTGGFLGFGGRRQKQLTTTSPVAGAFTRRGATPEEFPTDLTETPNPRETVPTWGNGIDLGKTQTGYRKGPESAGQPAVLEDFPSHPRHGGARVLLETAAIVLDGSMAKTYLGSVEWGYRAEPGEAAQLEPEEIRLVSPGVPSERFMAAALAWNRLQELVDPADPKKKYPIVPIPIQYEGLEDIKDLPTLLARTEKFLQAAAEAGPESRERLRDRGGKLFKMLESEGLAAFQRGPTLERKLERLAAARDGTLRLLAGFGGPFKWGAMAMRVYEAVLERIGSLQEELKALPGLLQRAEELGEALEKTLKTLE